MRSPRVGHGDDEFSEARLRATSWLKLPRRWAIVVLCGLVGLLPLTVLGGLAAIKSNVNDVRDWLPAHFAETSSVPRV